MLSHPHSIVPEPERLNARTNDTSAICDKPLLAEDLQVEAAPRKSVIYKKPQAVLSLAVERCNGHWKGRYLVIGRENEGKEG